MRWTLAVMIGAIAIAIARPSPADTTLTIATVNNGDMIRMQMLTDDFKKRNPGIDLEWVTRGECASREGHDRHCDESGPVRRADDRHLRGADLGQAGLAGAAQPRCRLRCWRPPAADPQRPVVRRQALRRAVLRRKLDADVPQRPVREGGAHDARKADLGLHQDGS